MPSPDEWSALWGALGLAALLFAWVQLRQVSESNQALIKANEESRRVAIEAARPRVQVSLALHRSVFKNPSVAQGVAFIEVLNTGASTAEQVRMTVSPSFSSKSLTPLKGTLDEYFATLNESFAGDVVFEHLRPGVAYVWTLGEIPDLFVETDTPRRYVIEVQYQSPLEPKGFRETHTIDLNLEGRADNPVDPIRRLGKQVEVLTDAVLGVKKQIAAGSQKPAPRLLVSHRNRRGRRKPW